MSTLSQVVGRGAGAPHRLSPSATSFLAGTIGIATLLGGLALALTPPASLHLVFVWALAALAGEFLTFNTATSRARINLATTIHLAMVLTLSPGALISVLWISRSAAQLLILRNPWYRAWFNVAQVSLAVIGASLVFDLLGGSREGLTHLSVLAANLPAFIAAGLTYYLINTGAVSVVVAITSQEPVLRTWRENYGYAQQLLATAGLMLLAPIAAVTYASLGWVGLVAFVVPLLFIRGSSLETITLRRTQESRIATERLSAKVEIAAEVGHEINNCLAGAFGQVQLLLMRTQAGSLTPEDAERRLHAAMTQLDTIATLSRGLVDSARPETRIAPYPINGLIESTLDLVEPQARFRNVEFSLDLDPRLTDVPVDPGKIQQALLNLLINSANAMEEAKSPERRISVWVRLHDVAGEVEVGVSDTGPGVPHDVRNLIFEPGFTTRSTGHGFGLSTAHQIAINHGGRLTVEDGRDGGALFRVLLPLTRSVAA